MYSIQSEPIIHVYDNSIRIPLTMGTGSPIVKVANNRGVFVERGFDSLLSPVEINDETQITLWASQHKIAPKVHSYNLSHIVMDWIDGAHIQELSLDQIADLAAVFKNMHSITPPKNISNQSTLILLISF